MNTAATYYLAGPMTGYPHFNFPRFYEVANDLREQGFIITSPAELETEKVKIASRDSETGEVDENGMVAGHTWGDFLSRDVKVIADECDGVIAMDNWMDSKGARLEVFTALQQKKPTYWYKDGQVQPLRMVEAMDYMRAAMLKGA